MGPKLHYYSPVIAKQMNAKQPDVTAATLLTNLSFWQKNKYPSTLIDGRRHSFRSLKQLQKDCPYLTKEAIRKAIERLETALGEQFRVNRTKKVFYFSIGDATMERLKIEQRTRKQKEDSTKHFSFLPDDAKKTGSIRSAVLLNNLKYQLAHFRKPKQDGAGNKYGQLSAAKLAPILGFSADTISRALSEMRQNGHLIPHATDAGFYALPDEFKGHAAQNRGNAEVHTEAAEVHTTPAEIHGRTAEVHRQPAEVHTTTLSNPIQTIDAQGFERVKMAGCINGCVNSCGNECGNECVKDRVYAELASPLCDSSQTPKGLIMLMDLAEAKLSKMRSEKKPIQDRPSVHQDELPYDVIDPYELPYDFVTERERTFFADLEEGIQFLKYMFKESGHIVTEDDEAKFRRFLTDNPQVDSMDLWDLYLTVIHPPWVFTSMKDQESHPDGILTKVKTPTQFLRYLPQIIILLHRAEMEKLKDVVIDPPFDNLNYAYMGEAPNNSMLSFDDGSVPSEIIED